MFVLKNMSGVFKGFSKSKLKCKKKKALQMPSVCRTVSDHEIKAIEVKHFFQLE